MQDDQTQNETEHLRLSASMPTAYRNGKIGANFPVPMTQEYLDGLVMAIRLALKQNRS